MTHAQQIMLQKADRDGLIIARAPGYATVLKKMRHQGLVRLRHGITWELTEKGRRELAVLSREL